MARRTWWKAAVVIGALGAVWLARRDQNPDAIAASAAPSQQPASPGSAVALPALSSEAPAPSPVTLLPAPDGGAQIAGPRTDRASLMALDRFQFESMPAIDGCLGSVRAPRAPQTVLARFERVSTSASGDVYMARDVMLAPGSTGVARTTDARMLDCVNRIRARQIVLPVVPNDQAMFMQPLTLLLPVPQPAQPH